MATAVAEKGPLGLDNPMGTDGFEFVEYTAPDIELLRSLFTKMGFPEVARHEALRCPTGTSRASERRHTTGSLCRPQDRAHVSAQT